MGSWLSVERGYTGIAAQPTFSPVGGIYSASQSVTISTVTGGASIYYTSDGSTPTTGSNRYAGPVTVAANETLKAIAVLSGHQPSTVGSASYIISSAQTFDYYVSTIGSDTNPGTLSLPWALTSFANGSANQALMAGKRIGILPGTYTITSSFPTAANQYTSGVNQAAGWLGIPSGTSAHPTYVGSSDASGFYSPRTATIKWNGGPLPFSIFANYPWATDNVGWMTIDGIIINGNGATTYAFANGNRGGQQLVQFVNASTIGTSNPTSANITGVSVLNCDIGNMVPDFAGLNYGLIRLEGVYSATIQNNYLHSVVPTGAVAGPNNGNPSHVALTVEIGCYNNQYLNNTLYNGPGGLWVKEGCTGAIAAYNYFYYIGANGIYGTSEYCSPLIGWDDAENAPNVGPAGYLIYQIHHNIMDSCVSAHHSTDVAPGGTQSKYAWNNTVYDAMTGGWVGWTMGCHGNNSDATPALTKFYNNIYVTSSGGSGNNSTLQAGKINVNSVSTNLGTLNNNCYYAVNGSYASFWGVGSTQVSAFATWQSNVQGIVAGSESASVQADPKFSPGTTNIVGGNGPSQFQLATGSPCLNTGIGSVSMGAWDGTVTQIGCSFKQSGPWP